jgi:glutamine synthetase
VNKNIYKMSHRSGRHLRIDELPGNLSEAIDELEKSALMKDTLGEHIFEQYITPSAPRWDSYIRQVSPWDIERFQNTY